MFIIHGHASMCSSASDKYFWYYCTVVHPFQDHPGLTSHFRWSSSLFRASPSFETVVASVRDSAKNGLTSEGARHQQGARWLGCDVKLGVVYMRGEALFSRNTSGLGDRGQNGLIVRISVFFFSREKPIYLVLPLLRP